MNNKRVDFLASVSNCARCEGNHDDLPFTRFERPIVDQGEPGYTWTHWSICPTSGDPILLRRGDGPRFHKEVAPSIPKAPDDPPGFIGGTNETAD